MNAHECSFERFFTECYQQYRAELQHYIAARMNDACEAEDMTQDIFLRLWEHRGTVNRITARPLLFTIARNLVTDRIRRRYKTADITDYIYTFSERTDNATTESKVNMNELAALHERLVTSLPPRRQLIYRMSFFQDMSCPQIAQSLSLSLHTVRRQLVMSDRFVRTALNRQYAYSG